MAFGFAKVGAAVTGGSFVLNPYQRRIETINIKTIKSMTNQPESHLCAQLPTPEIPTPRLTTYVADEPDTHYPPIENLRPPDSAPNILIVRLDDVGLGQPVPLGNRAIRPRLKSWFEWKD